MSESPKSSPSSDAGADTEGLIRLTMSPAPSRREKRAVSIISPFSSTSLAPDVVQSPEDLLVSTLLAIEGDEVSYDVFQFVIEMLDDMSKHYIPGQATRDIFNVIFSLLVKAVGPIQVRVVANLNQMITNNPGIVQFTKDTEWLSELLIFLPRFEDTSVLDELFKMIELLGSYHISVKQVKMIFKLFQVEDTAFKSYYWQNIFPLLQRLWHGRDGRPNDYFELDGYNSGLLLPPIKLPSGGYSIATWVYASSFSSNYTRDTYQPYLFSFLTEDCTSGIEAHFNRGKLILRTNPAHANVSKREMRIVNYDFAENRWYFIALTHTKKLILSDECNVYVNGESVQHFNLKYPKPDQTLKNARLGTAGVIPEPRSCLRGKLAGFLAFDDTLNADEVRALYLHGPNLFSSLRPLEQLVLMPRSRLARRPNVLFFYSPRATDCSVCLEPWTNDTSRSANMLPGVRTCITTGFQDSLSSVGGIQLFLPLFSSKYRPSSSEMVDVNTKVIALMIELVSENQYAMTEMLRSRFFQIMGYLLATDFNTSSKAFPSTASSTAVTSSSTLNFPPIIDPATQSASSAPQGNPMPSSEPGETSTGQSSGPARTKTGNKWSPQSIEVLDKLAHAVSGFGATNTSQTNGPLFEQIFRHVYLNFHIWTSADYEVQLALLKSINNFVKRDPEQFHQYLSVSQLMTILNEHFTYAASSQHESKSHSSSFTGTSMLRRSFSLNVIGPAMPKTDWSKRSRAQLMELRKTLLGTLHLFIQVGISLKETKAIVNYLHHEAATKSEDRRLITDVLQVLLIGIGEKHASLLHHLHALGDLAIFLPLLKAENEKFRVWTLKVIGKLIQNAEVEPTQKDSILDHLASLRKVLEPYPLSTHTYNVLLEILIDSVSADGLINPVDWALHPSTPPGAAITSLKNLKMISVIFQLLNARSDTELRIKVLKDFLFYLKKGPENRAKFTAQHDWQAWLLSLLVPESPASIGSHSGPTAPSSTGHGPLSAPSTGPISRRNQLPPMGRPTASKQASAAANLGSGPHMLHINTGGHITSVTETAAHNVLLGLVTEIFSLIFEAAFLQPTGAAAIFEGTSAVLRRMGSIRGFDGIAVANTINTRVLKTMIENNLVARCRASPLIFQTCVQYLTFVESTFFKAPALPMLAASAIPSAKYSGSDLSNASSIEKQIGTISVVREVVHSVGGASDSDSLSVSGSSLSSSPHASMTIIQPSSLRNSISLSSSGSSGSMSADKSLVASSSMPNMHGAGSNPHLSGSYGVNGSHTVTFGEKDTIRFGDRPLLPLLVHYGANGSWISFTLAQRILELVDQLVMNKIERTPTLEIAPELLDRLEAALSRFRTRLILYSITEGATFKSTVRLKMRKDSIRNIRQVIYDGFTSAASKGLAGSEMPSGGVHASLQRYLSKKAKQWDTEMSDVDSMFHKNIKRIRALLESTPSTHAALYLVAYIGALVQKANSSPQAQGSALSASTSSMSSSTSSIPSLGQTQSSGSSPSIILSPSKDSVSSTTSSNGGVFSAPGSPTNVPAVQHTDESVQLTQQLWKDAIQNIKQRLSGDANYGPMMQRLEGEVLGNFFESGFASPKDFVLAPAIDKAIEYIVANDMNAMNAAQTTMKTITERYTDITQEATMTELEGHKRYEQEYMALASSSAAAAAETSELYHIRHSQYIAIIASEWKNLLRVLLDTRGPWSSPYANNASNGEVARYNGSDDPTIPGGAAMKLYWKLDSTENSQRMRIKMKRHYGDMSIVEFASAKNDEKERQMIEQLQMSISGGMMSPSPMSPSNSLTTLPPFEIPPSASSASGAQSSAASKAELLKLVALRRGNATPLDEDDAGLIDTQIGGGDDGDLAASGSMTPQKSQSSAAVPGSASSSASSASSSASAAASSSKSLEERTLLVTSCEYVKGIASIAGDFEVTTLNIYFRNLEHGVFKTIPLEKLKMIYSRRFMLRNTALEFFTTGRTSHFFHFDKESPAKILKVIVDRRPSNLREYFAGSSQVLARKKKHITEAWKKRQISNFEYLMELNTIAGRSYNDLSQYPVFPWIIADYESDRIDLNNPAIYRDLSKPVGALDEARLEKFLVRWDEMVKNADETQSTPPFMYGSHYSSHSIVLYYLIRLEPFTSQSLELQGGQFDLPARLFTSIPEAWKNCLINQSDVKELIPEFFFLPSFLTDSNDINLGCMKPPLGSSAPISIDSVQLPPWAPTPQAFIQMNRMALESEYVSAHLHEWIDLIFGHKQLGQDAIDANNVFYYTSYEGNIDIDSISDPTLKQSVQMQIREFGQTPSQLFTTPHPVRLSLEESQKAKRNALASLVATALSSATTTEPEWKPTAADLAKTAVLAMRPGTVANVDIVSIHVDSKFERFILVFMDGLIQTVGYKIPKGKRFPLTYTPGWAEADIINNPQKKTEHSLDNTASAPGLNPSQGCFAWSEGKILINCGSWDRSFSFSMVTSTVSLQQSISEHKDVVTCLALTQDMQTLVSGSRDCNVLVWDIDVFTTRKKADKDTPAPKPKFVLFGHDDAINTVAVNSDLNVIVTASQDCTSIVYDLSKGHYVRSIMHDSPVTLVAVNKYGDIATYCPSGELLYLHTINGALLQRLSGVGKLSTLKFSGDGSLLVTSGQNIITVRSLYQYSLKRIYLWKCPTAVSSIELFNHDEYLLIGLCNGTLLTVLFDMNKLLTDMSREMAMEKHD